MAITTITSDTGKIKGTLLYMSPEQAKGDPADTDVRSDVYALGVILYELLTGARPHDLRHKSMPEAVRIICEESPPTPSSRDKSLRGDLDTIILKALEKQPARRYQSASALADDIQRYLGNQPILARPPSNVYHVRKFIARHKISFSAAMLVLIVSVVGFGVSTSLYVTANAARRAEVEQRIVAQEVNRFLNNMLASVNPRQAGGKDVTLLRELLDDAARRIGTELDDHPAVQAPLENTIGQVYLSLGLYDDADRHLTSSLERFHALYGEQHVGALRAANNLAVLRQDQGRLQEARALLEKTLRIRRRTLGEDHAETLTSLNNLGNLYQEQRKPTEAQRYLKDALARRRRTLGEKHPDTLVSMNNLSNVLSHRGKHAEAESLLRELISAQQAVLPKDHIDLLVSQNDLALALKNQRKFEEAEPLYREVVRGFQRVLGDGHMDTLITTNNLASLLYARGQREEACRLFGQLVKTSETSLEPGHYVTAVFRGGYGRALWELKRNQEAQRELVACYHTLLERLGPTDSYTTQHLTLLIKFLDATEQPEEADKYRAMQPKKADPEPTTRGLEK